MRQRRSYVQGRTMLSLAVFVSTLLAGTRCQNLPSWYFKARDLDSLIPAGNAQVIQGSNTQARTVFDPPPPAQQRYTGANNQGGGNAQSSPGSNNQPHAWYSRTRGLTNTLPEEIAPGRQTANGFAGPENSQTRAIPADQFSQNADRQQSNYGPSVAGGLSGGAGFLQADRPPPSDQQNYGGNTQPLVRVDVVDGNSPLLQILNGHLKTASGASDPARDQAASGRPTLWSGRLQFDSQTRNIANGDQNLQQLQSQAQPAGGYSQSQSSKPAARTNLSLVNGQPKNLSAGDDTRTSPSPANGQTKNLAAGDDSLQGPELQPQAEYEGAEDNERSSDARSGTAVPDSEANNNTDGNGAESLTTEANRANNNEKQGNDSDLRDLDNNQGNPDNDQRNLDNNQRNPDDDQRNPDNNQSNPDDDQRNPDNNQRNPDGNNKEQTEISSPFGGRIVAFRKLFDSDVNPQPLQPFQKLQSFQLLERILVAIAAIAPFENEVQT